MSSEMTKTRSRRFRVTTRGMMLLILILGVFFGSRVNMAHVQQAALSSIQGMEGSVVFDYQIDARGRYNLKAKDPPGPRWLQRLIGPEYFRTIHAVQIRRKVSGLRDPGLDTLFLKGLPDLRRLYLTHNQLTDDDLSGLESMPHLSRLNLMNSPYVGDGALRRIGGLAELEELYLSDTGVTDAGLASLHGKNLRLLYLSNLPITDAGLAHVEGLTSLQWLALDGTQVTDAGLVHLEELSSLRRLSLERTNVTASGVAKLQEALPRTKIFFSPP